QLSPTAETKVTGEGITYSRGATCIEARILLSTIEPYLPPQPTFKARVYTGKNRVSETMMTTGAVAAFIE
ncbi:MAG: hypothetical protein Q8M76_09555, partial [Spirochaetaceae bacterium]|nr:hypothetical protein [Spirochaetaceae bacterium]